MSWGSWTDFWSMGGYTFYVWGSYGVTFGLLAAEVLRVRSRRHAASENARALRAQQGEAR